MQLLSVEKLRHVRNWRGLMVLTTYTGILERCPRIEVEVSTFETSRRTRGRNHTLRTYRHAHFHQFFISENLVDATCEKLHDSP